MRLPTAYSLPYSYNSPKIFTQAGQRNPTTPMWWTAVALGGGVADIDHDLRYARRVLLRPHDLEQHLSPHAAHGVPHLRPRVDCRAVRLHWLHQPHFQRRSLPRHRPIRRIGSYAHLLQRRSLWSHVRRPRKRQGAQIPRQSDIHGGVSRTYERRSGCQCLPLGPHLRLQVRRELLLLDPVF